MATPHLSALPLDHVPGTVSVWFGPPGGPPAFTRAPDAPHYAASLIKLALLVALYRGHDLDREIPVVNSFRSAIDGDSRAGSPTPPTISPYGLQSRHDQDDAVWDRLGGTASLRWLAERMIVRSSNLAANLVLAEVGLAPADAVWRSAGAGVSRIERGLGDDAAREAGLTNTVSAADVAKLLGTMANGTALPAAGQAQREALLGPLFRQERTEDLAAGLPPGTRVAHKNGWVRGVRHAAGIILPADAAPLVLVVCATTPFAVNLPGDAACRLVRTVASAAWADRTGAAT